MNTEQRTPLPLPKRLNLAQRPTPLQLLKRISRQSGGTRIWVKRDDMTGCGLSGNKVRKLEFILARALDEGYDTLITCGGVQSNHCRAVALLGAQLGLKVHLILRGADAVPDGNLLLDRLAGAEISFYPLKEYRQLDQLFEHWQKHYQAEGRKPLLIPTGGSEGVGLWGYFACARELKADCDQAGIEPGVIVCATGSGGTQAGLTVGAEQEFGADTQVIGMAVSDSRRYFERKVREDISDWQRLYDVPDYITANLRVLVNDEYTGPGYGIATEVVFDTIRNMARLEGLLLDPVYTGKAFYGMLQEIHAGRFHGVDDIVFVHTGGLFGLFAQREQVFGLTT